MIKDIKYNGYTAQPSDYECPDGDLAASLNLICEDGEIKPVPQPLPELTNALGLKPILIHQTASFNHYILIDASSNLYWLDYRDVDADTHTAPDDKFIPIDHSFADCSILHSCIIGNFIVLATSLGMFYILWSPEESKYLPLGSRMPEINIEFALFSQNQAAQGHRFEFSIEDTDGKYTEALKKLVFGDSTNPRIPWRPSETNTIQAIKSISNCVIGAFNKYVADNIAQNMFIQPFFIRYAYRLFDGSNTLLSPPVLMMPHSRAPRIKIEKMEHSGSSLVCDNTIRCTPTELAFRILSLNLAELKKWKSIITHVDFFATPQITSYNQESDLGVAHRVLDDNTRFSHSGACITSDTRGEEENAHRHYPNSDSSPSNSFYKPRANCEILESAEDSGFWELDYKPRKEIEADITSSFLFYQIASFDFDEIMEMTNFSKVNIEGKALKSLTSRKTLEEDLYSHDTLVPEYLYPYNGRLSVASLQRSPFEGFPIRTMCQYVQTKNNTSECSFSKIDVYVKIKSSDKTRWVNASSPENSSSDLSPYTYDSIAANFPRWLFYPDSNATEIIISVDDGYWRLPLSKHEFLNGAYWFRGIGSDSPEKTEGPVPSEVTSGNSNNLSAIPMENRVFNSEINNPLLFPVKGMVSVGVGSIYGICSAAKALSQGQFGQFPLYAFSSEGVWAISIAADGLFSARQPITRDVILDNTRPLQLDSAVLFATKRGIMLISGSQTQCVSDIINTKKPFDVRQLYAIPKLYAMLGHGPVSDKGASLPSVSFLEFIEQCGMLYDYIHQRVIVFNPAYSYAYVFSLKSKQWGMMYSTIKAGINSYPEALAVDTDGALLSFSDIDGVHEKGLLVTRPLKLDAPDVLKTVDTIIQRGFFQKGHVQSVLYGSRDLFSWHLVWSSKDHYLRGFRGTPYKYFRIALLCDLSDGESIYGASLQFTPRQINQPR